MTLRKTKLPLGQNWVWEVAQKWLAADISKVLPSVADAAIQSEAVPAATDEFEAHGNRHLFECGLYLGDSPCRPGVYPSADLPPAVDSAEPWASFTVGQMLRRVEAIVAAAMTIYLELTAVLAPQFRDTLAYRGLMPVRFYGDMHYKPDAPRGRFDYQGPQTPGLSWLVQPIGDAHRSRPRPTDNRISITANDTARHQELVDHSEAFLRPIGRTSRQTRHMRALPETSRLISVRWTCSARGQRPI
jgi:hypothetical protein